MSTSEYIAAVVANKGKRRPDNEDNFYFDGLCLTEEKRRKPFSQVKSIRNFPIVLGVFDGMGGASYGERASWILSETVLEYHNAMRNADPPPDPESLMREMILQANDRIRAETDRESVRQMGTTCTLLIVQDDIVHLCNVGDSRAFRVHDGRLTQVSVDDTVVGKLVELGVITKEESKVHKDRHRITQYVGMDKEDAELSIHFRNPYDVVSGDRFLLCSDGLTDMVDQDRIEAILLEEPDSLEAAQALVREAMEKGGHDNITVVLLDASASDAVHTAGFSQESLPGDDIPVTPPEREDGGGTEEKDPVNAALDERRPEEWRLPQDDISVQHTPVFTEPEMEYADRNPQGTLMAEPQMFEDAWPSGTHRKRGRMLLLLLSLLGFGILFCAVGGKYVYDHRFIPVKEYIITDADDNLVENTIPDLMVDDTRKLNTAVEPENATDQEVVYMSDNEDVVMVDDQGYLTAVGAGDAVITVTDADCPKKGERPSKRMAVHVNPVAVTGIETLIDGEVSEEVEPLEGRTMELTFNVVPENATNRTVTYGSSDDTIATVVSKQKIDEAGYLVWRDAYGNQVAEGTEDAVPAYDETRAEIIGVSPGTATITVASVQNPEVTTMIQVTVKERPRPVVAVTPKKSSSGNGSSSASSNKSSGSSSSKSSGSSGKSYSSGNSNRSAGSGSKSSGSGSNKSSSGSSGSYSRSGSGNTSSGTRGENYSSGNNKNTGSGGKGLGSGSNRSSSGSGRTSYGSGSGKTSGTGGIDSGSGTGRSGLTGGSPDMGAQRDFTAFTENEK